MVARTHAQRNLLFVIACLFVLIILIEAKI